MIRLVFLILIIPQVAFGFAKSDFQKVNFEGAFSLANKKQFVIPETEIFYGFEDPKLNSEIEFNMGYEYYYNRYLGVKHFFGWAYGNQSSLIGNFNFNSFNMGSMLYLNTVNRTQFGIGVDALINPKYRYEALVINEPQFLNFGLELEGRYHFKSKEMFSQFIGLRFETRKIQFINDEASYLANKTVLFWGVLY